MIFPGGIPSFCAIFPVGSPHFCSSFPGEASSFCALSSGDIPRFHTIFSRSIPNHLFSNFWIAFSGGMPKSSALESNEPLFPVPFLLHSLHLFPVPLFPCLALSPVFRCRVPLPCQMLLFTLLSRWATEPPETEGARHSAAQRSPLASTSNPFLAIPNIPF